MKKSIQIAFAGIMAALSIVLLFFGSVVWLLAYIVPIMTGMIIYIIKSVFGSRLAFLTFVSVAILSLFMLPDKECALMYSMFFGYYPLIKFEIEKIHSKIISYLLKIFVFNVCIAGVELLCFYVFHIPFDNSWGKWGIIALILSFNIVFVLYDRLFVVFSLFYDRKISKYLYKYIK